ncbi:MAG: hypothetical protein AAFW60_02930, partial [Pseudomonadota bacterium]
GDVIVHLFQINQHPIGIWQTFQLRRLTGLFLDLLCQMIGNGADMTGRATRSNDHDVCERGFFRQINNREVFGFVIFQSGDDRV